MDEADRSTIRHDRLLYRPTACAEKLDLSRAYVYRLISSGELESVQIGRSRRIPAAAIDAYIERLRATSAA